MLNTLGQPLRTLPQQTPFDGIHYLYSFDSVISVRYDFGLDDRVKTILVLAGSVVIPPTSAIAANTQMINRLRQIGRSRPMSAAPPPPIPLPFSVKPQIVDQHAHANQAK